VQKGPSSDGLFFLSFFFDSVESLCIRFVFYYLILLMAITAAQVHELRKKTGVGMMACKKALTEAEGDMDQAIDLLRKRGESKASSKADRATSEGGVGIAGRAAVAIACETDFVALNDNYKAMLQEVADKTAAEGVEAGKAHWESIRTDKMQEMGENLVLSAIDVLEGGSVVGSYVHSNRKIGTVVVLDGGTEEQARDLAMHATAMMPSVANPEDVPMAEIEKEISIYKEQLAAEGKPENIMEKILSGKVRKYRADRALTSQTFVKDSTKTVQEYLGATKVVAFKVFTV
jgi:elongation factor Ts